MLISRVGSVGVPVIGYNFSLANVWGHVGGPWARGGALSVAFRALTHWRSRLSLRVKCGTCATRTHRTPGPSARSPKKRCGDGSKPS